jgi:hypothetical protein
MMQLPDKNLRPRMARHSWRDLAPVGYMARLIGPLLSRKVRSFVFVASTGRSGTATLAEILSMLPESYVEHEGYPDMGGAVNLAYNRGDDRLMRQCLLQRKLPRIHWRARHARLFAETNHMFLQSYGFELAKYLSDRMHLIHLVRDPHAVVCSMLGRRDIPGTPRGDKWTLVLNSPRNVLAMEHLFTQPPFDHDYYKVRWFTWEIQARLALFRQQYACVPVVNILTEDMNDKVTMVRKLGELGVSVDESAVAEKIGERANSSPRTPADPGGIVAADVEQFDAIAIRMMDKRFGQALTREVLWWRPVLDSRKAKPTA